MADPRILDYLRQNQASYPLDALKAALIKNGFPPAEVEAAARLLYNPAPPPQPQAPESAPLGEPAREDSVEPVRFSLGQLIPNAVAMLKSPAEFFPRVDPAGGLGGPMLYIGAWACAGGVLSGVSMLLQTGSPIAAAGGAVVAGLFVPVFACIFSFLAAGVFHIGCRIIGGEAPYSGSYAALGAMSALFPIGALLGAVPFGSIAYLLAGLYYAVHAAEGVHRAPRAKAWAVFGCVAGVLVALTVYGTIAMRRLQSAMPQMLPGQVVPAGGEDAEAGATDAGLPADPEEAMKSAQRLLQGMEGAPDGEEFQQAMAEAQRQSGQILSDLGRYQALAEPPAQTLALLDKRGRALLADAWPAMSAPVRKSLVETLPQTPAKDRTQALEMTIAQTKQLDPAINQSMQLLQGMLEQQGGKQRQK